MIPTDVLRPALAPLPLDDQQLRDLAEALRTPPPRTIRLRPGLSPALLPFATEPVPWHEQGYVVAEAARPGRELRFATGDYYIQDAASLLPLALLAAQPGQVICDLCAAPGGKATAIVEALGPDGWLLANEPIGSRVGPLKLNLDRHGAIRFLVSQLDPQQLAARLGPVFDAVLVDAPCTGQSLAALGKKQASAFSPRQIEHSAARQARILDAAAQLVRPGGRLVYSTCTFSPAENEQQIERFLRDHPGWQLWPEPVLEQWQSPLVAGTYRLWPHQDPCAGGFAARLVRDQSDQPVCPASGNSRSPTRLTKLTGLPALADWGRLEPVELYGSAARCFGWPESPPAALLSVARLGPEIAHCKGKTWLPAYGLAMRRDPGWKPHQTVLLDSQRAAQFLAGENVPTATQGWAVATWQERPLGWIKGDGRTGKNHLPKPARLHIDPVD